jgi:Ca2+-binding RTX toxin-like protein
MATLQQHSPVLIRADTIEAVADSGNVTSFPIRLWRYGVESSISELNPNQNTILIIHGRQSQLPQGDRPLSERFPRLDRLAKNLTTQSQAQILFLDWAEAATDGRLPPTNAARRIRAVANWVADQGLGAIAPQSQLTLIGHSLGTYVAAEIGQTRQGRTELVALDPAFPADDYDVDGFVPDQQGVAPFEGVSSQSFSLVVADDVFQTGLAGDNDQAGTAQASFVVRLNGLRFGLFNADEAHGAMIDVYADVTRYIAPQSETFSRLIRQFPEDRYDNGGDRQPGLHEGVAYAQQQGDSWQIERVDGEGVDWYFVAREGDRPNNDDGGLDTVLSQVTFDLEATLENLILAGSTDLNGNGNALDNWIVGNSGNNVLMGKGGADELHGLAGNDDLMGNAGSDILLGGDGDDRLSGDLGNDILNGGLGDDILSGGVGADELTGGGGQDTFLLEIQRGRDTITDFENGSDRLGLTDGLTLADLDIVQRASGTVIRTQNTAIALLIGIESSLLDASDLVVIG